MSFEASERILSDLGRQMISAAGSGQWDAVAEMHGELHHRLVSLFQSETLPEDDRPVRLLEQMQEVGESIALSAGSERRQCRRLIEKSRRGQQARHSYTQCFLA